MWFHKIIATTFGLGMAPFAPGTFGAFGALLFLYTIHNYVQPVDTPFLIVCIIISTLLGVWSTYKVIPDWGDDPSRVVIDEFVGVLVTMLFVPMTPLNLIMAFVLFRFFDIAKPFGIRLIDKKLKGAWGVMLDDVLAGVYSCILLHIILQFI